MSQKDAPNQLGPEEDNSASPSVDDQRSGGIYFEDNQTVQIEGDVITGGVVNKTTFQGPVTGPMHTGSGNIFVGGANTVSLFPDFHTLFQSVQTWLANTLRLADAPVHMRTSWVGWSIYVLRRLTDSITVQHWWTLVTLLTLWVATVWLVTPILQWPLTDVTARGRACLLYAIATLVAPFFVALTTPVDRRAEMVLDTRRVQISFWFLKLTGAYTGFALAAGAIGIAMVAYYLGWQLPRGVQWLLALIVLFFSHIGARRIPGDRLQMFGEVRLHEVDYLVTVVFLLLGPGVAAVVYWGYALIANPGMGLLLLITLSALALWEVRQRRRDRLADWALIAILGLLLPSALMLSIFVFTIPTALPSTSDWWALAMVTPYFLGMTLLIATIFVRNPPTLTIRGMVGLLVVQLGISYVLSLNLWLGCGLLIAVVLFWIAWGSRAWRNYLWVHPSFGWMLVALGGSVYVWMWTGVAVWANVLGFSLVVLLLTGWVYRSSPPCKRVLPE